MLLPTLRYYHHLKFVLVPVFLIMSWQNRDSVLPSKILSVSLIGGDILFKVMSLESFWEESCSQVNDVSVALQALNTSALATSDF